MELGLAVAGILPLALELSKLSRKYYKSFRRAPAEARRFGNLIEDVSNELDIFCKTARQVEEKKIELAEDRKIKKAVKRLKRTMEASILEIRIFSKKLRVIGNRKYSCMKRVVARVKWIIGEEQEIKALMANLNITKLDITFLLMTFSIKIQLRIIEEMEQQDQPIPKYLIQELILLRERNDVLKRRYEEAVQERDALAASTATHGTSSRNKFTALSQSFGQDVHDIVEQQMPAAETMLDEIVQGHTDPSPTETTTNSSTTDAVPPRREAESRTHIGMARNAPFAEWQRNEAVEEAENATDTGSSEGSITTRRVVGIAEGPEMRHQSHESHQSLEPNREDVLQETMAEIAEIDLSHQEERSVDSQAAPLDSDSQNEEADQHHRSRQQPYRMVNVGGKLVGEPWDRPGAGGPPSVGSS